MGENKRQGQRAALFPNNWIIWGASGLAAMLMFAILLLVILVMGRVSVAMAFTWAAGAALITLIVVGATGMAFYRIPSLNTSRRDHE